MASGVTLKVTGLNESVRAMVKAGVAVDDLKEVFSDVGDQVVRKAKVASTAKYESGDMQGTIRSSKRRNGTIISVGNEGKVNYAQYPIFGTIYQSGFNFVEFAVQSVNVEGQVQKGINQALSRAGL